MLIRPIFLILFVAVFSSISAQSAMALTKDLIEQQGNITTRENLLQELVLPKIKRESSLPKSLLKMDYCMVKE